MATQSEYEIEDWQTAYSNAKTHAEREQAIRDYEAAKLRNAERREQARLDRAIKRSQKRRDNLKKGTQTIKSWAVQIENNAKTILSTIKNFFQKTK